MQFNVVLPGGSRYGPASIDTLNEWIAEGRVLPGTTLENTLSGELMLAQDLVGLVWHPAAPHPVGPHHGGQPSQQPYPGPSGWQPSQNWRPVATLPAPGGDGLATASFVASLLSFCGCCVPVALGALWLGYTARARGSLQGGSAVAFAWLAVFVTACYWLAQTFGLRALGN